MLRRQRLGLGDVEGGPDPAGRDLGQQGVGVHQPATGDVDQQRLVRQQRAAASAPIRPSVSGVCGAMTIATSASGSRASSSVDRVHLDGSPVRAPPRHPGDRRDLEAGQPPLDGRTDVAVADDQHPLVGQRAAELEAPAPGGCMSRAKSSRCRPLASVSAIASSAVLASCTPAALHRVTPSGTCGQEVLDPGGQGLDDLQAGHLARPVEHLGARM